MVILQCHVGFQGCNSVVYKNIGIAMFNGRSVLPIFTQVAPTCSILDNKNGLRARCFLGGGFKYFFMFIPTGGRFPF